MAASSDPGNSSVRKSANSKTPPIFAGGEDNYPFWKREMGFWKEYTELKPEEIGFAILFRIEDSTAKEAIMNLKVEKIKCAEGYDNIIKCLDDLYEKDKSRSMYEAYSHFENYRRPKGVGVNEFLNEFENRYQRTKAFDIEMSENLLAYRVLLCANISTYYQQMVRISLDKWDYKEMKNKLKSIFSDYNMDGIERNSNVVEDICEASALDVQDTFYTQNRGNSYYNNRGRVRSNTRYQNFRPNRNRGNNSFRSRGSNPIGRDGRISTCSICGSRYHWADSCPDKNQVLEINEVHLFDTDFEETSKLKNLVSDTLDSAVLDSAASKTAAGKIWVEDYISKLGQEERNNLNKRTSHSVYKFGDGETVSASYAITIPAQIGERKVKINLDVLNKDIPCLLSKASMKEIDTKLDFMNDEVTMLNQKIPLFTSRSGHYCIPLTKKKRAIIEHSSENNPKSNITLVVSNHLTAKEVAQKLHVQFSHPSPNRLASLVESANPKNAKAILKEIKSVSKNCHICKEYRKAPRRPIVGLPLAHSFNEVLQIDLKFINSKIILHMIDSATRLSSCTILSSKSADQVMNGLLRYWISLYGAPQKYHTDNGGEFCNELIQEMAEKFNITVHTTPAESPWANGITERHNAIIEEMVNKTMADTNCSLPIALMWAVNAKNSLSSVNGYSPYTLVYGRNPNLPNFLENKLPAMSESTENDILRQHLEAKAKARESFIKAESSAKLQRAMCHNIRSTNNSKYFTGDVVLYKRNNSKKWHGPGTVLGQDGQTVLVKHGHNYVRVHPCRLLLDNPSSRKTEFEKPKGNLFKNINPLTPVTFYDSSDNSSSTSSESDVDSATESNPENESDSTEENTNPMATSNQPNDEIQEQTKDMDTEPKEINSEDKRDERAESSETVPENDNDFMEEFNVFSDDENNIPPQTAFDLNKLKKNMNVKCKLSHNNEWIKVKLASRAGRATGKYKYEWNTTLENGENMVINFAEHVSEIEEILENQNEEYITITENDETINTLSSTKDEKLHAKLKELQSWKEHGVYVEKDDDGSKCITTKWVLKDKIINNLPSTKARLCIRGFEEEANLRRDSPTAMKESVRFALGIAASKGWKLRSLDVKTAFLQSKRLERSVLIRPPREAQTDKLWLLLKPVYGLGDASRLWYLTVREKLKNLNSVVSKYDQGLFHFHSEDSELTAVLIVFVDDILTLGQENVIKTICENLKDVFHIGSESSDMFRYIGMHMSQEPTYVINLEQLTYINSIVPIPTDQCGEKTKESAITTKETKALRSLVGKLNWTFQVSRPDIGFQTRYLSTIMHQAKVKDLYFANKALKYLQCEPKTIKFPNLRDIKETFLLVFADASYGNLPSGHSQAAFIILLCDQDFNSFPVGWNSYKLHRVCCNTLAAETLALNEALDNCVLLSTIYSEVIYHDSKKKIPIKALTDSKSLVAASSTTNLINEKRLRIEVAALRESIENEELSLNWIDSKYQLANCLTKAGASSKTLCEVITTGRCSKEIIAALNM